ncbi:M24 family metallopeptidase [Anaeroselena agilis]|uniref:Aminopeptidase P family protein n=1 Tax=Anaeroselena agilis TaxID=3063788 RepID=A0ABU3NW65_9FIRM|nr:aminopeptidase P family protein [Selenomonadales bacterium 4137-cl]
MTNRLHSLRTYIATEGLAAVIVAKPENRRYFSGFTGSSGLLLVSADAAKLITDFRYIVQAGREAPDFAVVRHGSDLYETLAAEIKSLGDGKVGFESDFTTWDVCQKLNGIIAQPTPVRLDKLRMVKDEAELAALRIAVSLADDAFDNILGYLRPGISERDVALELEFFMRKNGAEKVAFDTIVASGPRSALPHGRASDRTIAAGDFVTMDFGAVYQGYHSDITRTVVVGKASARQREIYDLVLAAQLAGLDAVTAGKTGREVDAVARKVIGDAGFADKFGHGLGHGVGLEIHEEPRLSPSGGEVLAANMTVTVEPGVYFPDWGGVRIEDTVVVTAGGAQVLTASSKEFIQIS